VINAIKFAIEEIEASDQYFDHTGADCPSRRHCDGSDAVRRISAAEH
jgi:hypothetical protein